MDLDLAIYAELKRCRADRVRLLKEAYRDSPDPAALAQAMADLCEGQDSIAALVAVTWRDLQRPSLRGWLSRQVRSHFL